MKSIKKNLAIGTKLLLIGIALIGITSCKTTFFSEKIGNTILTNVELSQANFKTLGSFTGTATAKISQVSIKNDIGLIALAKENLLKNAAKAGVTLDGSSRTLTNVTIDKIENKEMVVITISAEVVEFIK